MDGTAEQLVGALRKCAPVKVRVVNAQDESRDVAVPHGRKRWSQVASTIEAMPWIRCELLDKSGAVLGYVQNDGAADELEDISAPASSSAAQLRWMLELMLRAQQTALTYRDKEHSALLQSMRDMMQVATDTMRENVEIMKQQRDAAVETARLQAMAENGDSMEQIVKLVEASPKIMSVLGPLMMALRAPRKLPAPAASTPPPAPPPPAPDAKGRRR